MIELCNKIDYYKYLMISRIKNRFPATIRVLNIGVFSVPNGAYKANSLSNTAV
jgi:hypothetical protein